MRNKIVSLAQMLTPFSICPLCQWRHRSPMAVCQPCQALFQRLTWGCSRCQQPLPNLHFPLCGQCLISPPFIDNAFIAYQLTPALQVLIHEFKYHQGLYLGSLFIKLMNDARPPEPIECLLPIPLHQKRVQTRGFNQAGVLAKKLAKQHHIPCLLNSVQKIKHTASQASLSANERRKNLRNAFISQPIPYKTVTLIDDIYTTGSTANELARTLKEQGVSKVNIWCIARAI